MSNSSSSSPPPTDLYCPLLRTMLEHSLNNHTGWNLGVVSVHGLVSCLGILENALVLWVLGFRLRRPTVSSIWVLNLAMSDFLSTLTLPLFTHYLSQSHSWELGGPLCSVQAFVFFLNMFVSSFLLAAISLDRCLLVARPVWSQNHRSVAMAWKVCGAGWLWAAANALPYFLFRAVTVKRDGRKLCYHHFALYIPLSSSPATLERNCKVRQGATAISKTLLAFLLPLVVIAGSYILFCLSLWKRSLRRKERTSTFKRVLILNNGGGGEGGGDEGAGGEGGGGGGKTPVSKTSSIFKTAPKRHNSSLLPPTSPTSPASPTSPSKRGEPGLSSGFTKMVASVIAAFTLCWAPYHVFCLMEVAAQYRPGMVALVEVGLPLATTFAFINPVLNPVLYVFSCPHFCVRIRHSLSALMEGLVEEGGGGAGGGGGGRGRKLSLIPLGKSRGGRSSVGRNSTGRNSAGGNSKDVSSPISANGPGTPRTRRLLHPFQSRLPSSPSSPSFPSSPSSPSFPSPCLPLHTRPSCSSKEEEKEQEEEEEEKEEEKNSTS